ncbi:MAG: SGNH/GDSL hydrolase family protein [Candidatus Cyclobacteriaceae bacterium M3_2C_046]
MANTKKKMLALGDSYTVGEGIPPDLAWPFQLQSQLAVKGTDLEIDVIAQTGWATNELLEKLQQIHLIPEYDIISILIGVNNQYRKRSWQNYHHELELIIKQAICLSAHLEKNIILLSIPDWGVTPFARERKPEEISQSIDQFNQINYGLSGQYGLKYVDVTSISRKVQDQPDLIAPDQLHPSARQYGKWVNAILPQALKILNS